MAKEIQNLDVRLGNLSEATWQLKVQLVSEDSSLAEWIRGQLEAELKKRSIAFRPYQDGRKMRL